MVDGILDHDPFEDEEQLEDEQPKKRISLDRNKIKELIYNPKVRKIFYLAITLGVIIALINLIVYLIPHSSKPGELETYPAVYRIEPMNIVIDEGHRTSEGTYSVVISVDLVYEYQESFVKEELEEKLIQVEYAISNAVASQNPAELRMPQYRHQERGGLRTAIKNSVNQLMRDYGVIKDVYIREFKISQRS